MGTVRQLYLVGCDLHDSVFVRGDAFTISGIASAVFGTLLLLRKFPMYVLLHAVVSAVLLLLAWNVRKLSENESRKV
jgi:membrane protein implicated in regulation of membrane protease activity